MATPWSAGLVYIREMRFDETMRNPAMGLNFPETQGKKCSIRDALVCMRDIPTMNLKSVETTRRIAECESHCSGSWGPVDATSRGCNTKQTLTNTRASCASLPLKKSCLGLESYGRGGCDRVWVWVQVSSSAVGVCPRAIGARSRHRIPECWCHSLHALEALSDHPIPFHLIMRAGTRRGRRSERAGRGEASQN